MDIEKVKNIKELLRCMNGEKACTNCYINEIAQEQETCCVNIVADMTLELINELESEVEDLKCELQKTRKETAMEILKRGKLCMPSGLREWIEKQYGVEGE